VESKQILKFLIKYFVIGGLSLIGIFLIITFISRLVQNHKLETINCELATSAQIEQAIFGLKDGYYVKNVYRYPSETGYFLSAKVFDETDLKTVGVAVWHVGGTLNNPTATLSINSIAEKVTPYYLGINTDMKLSMTDDGAKEAQFCADNN